MLPAKGFNFCVNPKIFLVLVGILVTTVRPSTAHVTDGDGDGEYSQLASILASVGVVAGGCVLVMICTWVWWRRQLRKLCPVPPPPDDDPVATFDEPVGYPGSFPRTSYGSIRQLDASALQSDQDELFIEPLPSLEALASATTRFYVNENGDARLSFESLQNGPVIIPPEDDPEIFAHDWFKNQELQFPRNDISFIQEVGTGWFGMVIESEAVNIVPFPRRCRVWVKFLRDEATDRERMKFLNETRVYRDSNHKNILKLLGHCIEASPYLLILECYPKGDLKSYLLRHADAYVSTLDSSGAATRRRMVLDIARGLHWMHDNEFIHQDLAARNCLVGNEGQIVIGDYGLATQLHKQDYFWNSGSALAVRWIAPDSVECTPSTIKTVRRTKEANIWSFGVLVWEICELAKMPYNELTDDQVITRVLSDKNYSLKPPSITNLPYVDLRNELAKLVSDCCHPIVRKRPTIADIVLHIEHET